MYKEEVEELHKQIEEGNKGKDINQRMYNMRKIINGQKIQPSEKMAINDPENGELVTDEEEIKRISLQHNVKILTKNTPREEDKEEIEKKRENHEKIMKEGNRNE